MMDKVQPLKREWVKDRIGELTREEMQGVGVAQRLWLSL